MAQSLESRITATVQNNAPLKDVEGVIADIEAAIADASVKLALENARSIDPTLTTPQARDARNAALDVEHDIRRLDASLGVLSEKRDAIQKADAEAARVARYHAAKAERDDLARAIRARYPVLAMELVALARRILASDAECEAVGRDSPLGAARLESAEHLARNCGYYWDNAKGGGIVTRIADMRLPLLGREGAYLPMRVDLAGSIAGWEKLVVDDAKLAQQPVDGLEPASTQP